MIVKFGGFIIHHKDCILRFIDRATFLSQKYDLKFNIEETEDYSWKIENFQKLHINFSFYDKIEYSVLLTFLNDIMLKEPTEIETNFDTVDFEYFTNPERFGSTNDSDVFGIFVIDKESVVFDDEN